MSVYAIEIRSRSDDSPGANEQLLRSLREAGLPGLESVRTSRLFLVEGDLDRAAGERIAAELLVDPVTEHACVIGENEVFAPEQVGATAFEVHPRPGVMDPVAESTLAELRAENLPVETVRTARRYVVHGEFDADAVVTTVGRVLANDCVEEVVLGTAGVRPSVRPPVRPFQVQHVNVRELDERGLERLSREAHLFLSVPEMRTIQRHFAALGREPTDLELEMLAQTWSEHCVHKTLRSAVVYRGAVLPPQDAASAAPGGTETRRYRNLLKETIVRATEELIAEGRGPQCLSVFKDNAGVIAFDEEYGLAFKVETHNHPSAIEPYGGAATGIGGVIRDVIGCGLGAKPIANTDVFCVAPSDWPTAALPKGVLHPWRVLRGVVRGVADYGNRMGIPTVNGTVYFDPRYLGNPLVFAGSVGLIPRNKTEKAAQPGDRIVLIGGRTGRDGIHGATFSSAELTDTHADEFSHAVQIGNAITEKRFLDAVLQARDAEGGCLYTAITDCGAGGLSSAVGEMGEHIGAAVELDTVPLKYAGLRYDEIWISEAQERMVLAVPPANLARFLAIMRAEEVEATVIGTFGQANVTGAPAIVLRYARHVVGELEMEFLHQGLPRLEREAEWSHTAALEPWPEAAGEHNEAALARLPEELARPNVASKEWIIRQYDHEVQGGSAIKPLLGPGRGPGDAAVLRPRLASPRGVAVGCGLAPHLADADPYWMAAASIDEAIRNVICVGGDLRQTAILDNFCWGRSDDPRQLGGLVRACQACYDVAKAYGVPFVSGKDSLNNEFALDDADVEPLLAILRRRAADAGPDAAHLRTILPGLEARLREKRRLAIPETLLISAISLIPDVSRCVTPDLKRAGDEVFLVGGQPQIGFSFAVATAVHRTIAGLVERGLVSTVHDVADGGWLVALAEMAIAGQRGATLHEPQEVKFGAFDERCATYLISTARPDDVRQTLQDSGVRHQLIARVQPEPALTWNGVRVEIAGLRTAWSERDAS